MTTEQTRINKKSRALKYRELVSLYLATEGIQLHKRRERKLSQFLADDPEPLLGDLQGLTDWCIKTHSDMRMDFSGGLNEAEAHARHDGASKWAVVSFRAGRGVAEHYVTLPLSVFAAVLREEATVGR